jgi:type IV secretion system protein TrbB
MSAAGEEEQRRRAREAFSVYAKPIAHLLEDDKISDIMLNAPARAGEPGDVWVDRAGEGLRPTGVQLSAREAETLIRAMAKQAGGEREWNEKHPAISFKAALDQFRVEANGRPATLGPTFTLRKYLKRDVTLAHYAESGELTWSQVHSLTSACQTGKTVLVVGETGSGKTTLANALLQAAATDTERRILIIEDTPELDCPAGPSTKIEVSHGTAFGYREAVRSALRQRPNAIVLGELLEPDDAVQALRAWTSGHQGLSTLHAGSVVGSLWMLYNLCCQSERGRHTTERAVADAVQVVVSVRRMNGRRAIEVGRVLGWSDGEFRIELIQ